MSSFRVPPNTIWKVYNYHGRCLGVYSGHPADIAASLADRSCGLLRFVHDPLPIEVNPPKALEDEVMVKFEGHGATGREEEWLATGASKLSHVACNALGGNILIMYNLEGEPSPVESVDESMDSVGLTTVREGGNRVICTKEEFEAVYGKPNKGPEPIPMKFSGLEVLRDGDEVRVRPVKVNGASSKDLSELHATLNVAMAILSEMKEAGIQFETKSFPKASETLDKLVGESYEISSRLICWDDNGNL